MADLNRSAKQKMYLLCQFPGELDEAAARLRSVLKLPTSDGQKRYGLNIGGGYYYLFASLGLDLCLCSNAGEVAFEEELNWPFYLWVHSAGDHTGLLRQIEDRLRADGVSTKWLEEPNQPPQRNAGSRPSSDDSSVSETSSSLGPRG